MTTTLAIITKKLAVLGLLLANVVALVVLASGKPAMARPMDFCDEQDRENVLGCDCFRGSPWLPAECAKGGTVYYCLDETRCLDDCLKSGPDCRKPV